MKEMEELKYCPVCNTEDFRTRLVSYDHFLTQEEFKIVQCKSCGFRFTNPRPSENTSDKYYESLDYISHSNKKDNFFSNIYQFVRNYSIRKKVRLIKSFCRQGKILDIGCGTGEFLNSLQNNNFETFGIEPNAKAREHATTVYNLNVSDAFRIEDYEPESFKIITLWHVLEHIYQLKNYISGFKKLLHPDGTLIVALPNSDSPDAKHYKKFWAGYDLPRHIYHFTPATVESLFSNAGFKIIKIQPMIFDAFYISMLSEKYKKNRFYYFAGFCQGLVSNLKAFFGKRNYSSLIYILRTKKD